MDFLAKTEYGKQERRERHKKNKTKEKHCNQKVPFIEILHLDQ